MNCIHRLLIKVPSVLFHADGASFTFILFVQYRISYSSYLTNHYKTGS